MALKKQAEEAEQADKNAAVESVTAATYSSSATADVEPEGSLASDEALQALRDKLSGGAS